MSVLNRASILQDWTHQSFIGCFFHILGAEDYSLPQEATGSVSFGLNIFYFTFFYITKVRTCKHYQYKRIETKAKKCLYGSSPLLLALVQILLICVFHFRSYVITRVQRRKISVDIFFKFFEIIFFFCVVAICDLVHDVETIFHLSYTQ